MNKKIIDLVDLEGSYEEKMNLINELIKKYVWSFGLVSEPVPDTHLKIKSSTDKLKKNKTISLFTKTKGTNKKE
jgi:hypothetical protein